MDKNVKRFSPTYKSHSKSSSREIVVIPNQFPGNIIYLWHFCEMYRGPICTPKNSFHSISIFVPIQKREKVIGQLSCLFYFLGGGLPPPPKKNLNSVIHFINNNLICVVQNVQIELPENIILAFLSIIAICDPISVGANSLVVK